MHSHLPFIVTLPQHTRELPAQSRTIAAEAYSTRECEAQTTAHCPHRSSYPPPFEGVSRDYAQRLVRRAVVESNPVVT